MSRKCKKPKFKVIVCCQGTLVLEYHYKTLFGALVGYAKQYLQKNKYGTMNFSLKQIFEVESED